LLDTLPNNCCGFRLPTHMDSGQCITIRVKQLIYKKNKKIIYEIGPNNCGGPVLQVIWSGLEPSVAIITPATGASSITDVAQTTSRLRKTKSQSNNPKVRIMQEVQLLIGTPVIWELEDNEIKDKVRFCGRQSCEQKNGRQPKKKKKWKTTSKKMKMEDDLIIFFEKLE
jgi:hypothetical protein